MIIYAVEKIRTILCFYKFIFSISTGITILLLLLVTPVIIKTSLPLYFSTHSYFGAILFNHYINRRNYIFYRNQGLSMRKVYAICWFFNIFISIITFIVIGFIWPT